jgi:AcrR family transcriptional regulator
VKQRAAHLGPEKRRPLVLDAALRLFAEHGYGGTSMDMLAAEAGVTKPVVYDCYPSKRKLFEALLVREEERLLEQVQRALPEQLSVGDPEALLTETYTAYLTAAAGATDSWRVVFASEYGAEPAVARVVQRARDRITEQIAGLAERALRARGLVDGAERAAWLAAYELVARGEAGVRLMLARPGDWLPEELGATMGRGAAAALVAELSRPARSTRRGRARVS